MKKILLTLLVGSIIFTGCKKDDSNCELTSASLQGTYKITSIKYKLNSSSPEQDVTSTYLQACDLDDLHLFKTGGVYTYQSSGVACDPPTDSYNDTWSLSGTTLTVEGTPATVSAYACNTFSISESDVNTTGDKMTVTFVRQ